MNKRTKILLAEIEVQATEGLKVIASGEPEIAALYLQNIIVLVAGAFGIPTPHEYTNDPLAVLVIGGEDESDKDSHH